MGSICERKAGVMVGYGIRMSPLGDKDKSRFAMTVCDETFSGTLSAVVLVAGSIPLVTIGATSS